MNKGILLKIVLALVLIGAIIGLGAVAYQAGFVHGAAADIQLPANGSQTFVYPPMMYGHPFFGFGGFGFLGCLVPFFLIGLVFFTIRVIFGFGHHGFRHMHHGYWGMDPNGEPNVPPMFSEWHRRAHEEKPEDKA
jgi:hypothetical protein